MKKITNKIIFIIITCASIISVASLTKTNAQEINRNDLTAYKTDMSSIISTEKRYYNAEYGISKGKDDSVKLILTEDKMLITGTIVDIEVAGKGEMKDFASVEDLPYYNDKTYRENKNVRNCLGTLYIDEGVENVGDRFLEGIKVHTATFPKTIKSIGENAFLNSNLRKVIISGKDIIIKDKAFFGCKYLNIISIKGKNVTIGNEVFSGTNIKKITLPEGTKSIGKKVFSNCKNLESVTIPNTVQNVGEGSFLGCSNLTSITIPEGVTSIENNMFSGCSSLTSITIPSSVTSIGSDAFSGCSSLTSIIIPEGVTSIGDNTFLGCTNLTNITIPSSVTSIGNNAFSGCSNLTSITIPEGVTSIGNNAFLDCNELTKIVIPERVETIGTLAFHGCNNLNNIVVEDKNTNYSSLNGILFNKDKTKLIKYPAKESSTEEYTVPNTTTEICDKAFSYCSNLISITIPEGVTSIGNNVFDDCINLEKIEVKTGNINYSSQNGILFNNDKTELIKYPAKKSSTEYTVPSTTNKICDTAFSNCNNLMNIYVEIANNTYTSENGILFNKNKTELIKYPAKKQANEYIISSIIKKIYDNAFENCVNLDNIEVNSENTNYSSENGILFNKNKTILIRYPAKKQDLEYTIPNTVTIVGDYAFSSCEGVKLITVPNTVTTLGKDIFSNVSKDLKIKTECNNKNITEYANKYKISIERIHEYKFKKIMDENKTILYTCKVCNADMEKEFNNTVDVSKNQDNSVIATVSDDNILIISGKGEMCERSKLSSPFEDNFNKIIINEGVTNIGKNIFQGMHNLEEVTIPSSVKIIEEYAFNECNSLSNIEIPEGVTSIEKYAFEDCSSLTDITISSSVTSIGNFAFYRCSLTTVEIPNSVITIGYYAFCGCKYLEEIIIPNSVTSIGASAFSDCNNLINVKILNDETINVGDETFSGCINLKKVETHGSIESIKKQTFKDCENLEEVIINGKVNSIGVRAFDGCSSLTSITISEGVTIIDEYAFRFCKNLTNITTLEGLTSIGNYAFTGCSSLANIEIPNTVTNIGNYAFSKCSSLTNITIPGSVTTMGEYTFSECTLLKDIKILEGVTSIGNYAFNNCTSLTDIAISSSVTSIGYGAFYGCSSLPKIEIPSSVTIIGEQAFNRCRRLTNITIPKGVTNIGWSTFFACNSLTSIIIPEGVTSIGDAAFESCTSLTSIIIPEGVTSIGNYAFESCVSLTSIEIPNTVTSIGNDAFLELPSKFKIKALCNNNYIKEYINTNQINCDLQLKHAEYEFAHINKEKNIIVYKCSRCEELYEDTSGTLAWDVSENQDETVIAVLSKDGTLTISGKGNMKDYTEEAPAPYCNNYKNIKKVIIEEGVTSIGDWAFNKCENFNNITIPIGITRIGNGAFSMNRLTSIIIPESVTSIGEQVFLSNNYTLSNIQVDKNNKNYSSEDGVLFNKEKTELIFYPEGKEEEIYTVPDSVETIGKYAFYFSGLNSVIIPESVTSIGEYAFYGSILINVTIPEGVKNIRDEAFSECNTLSNVTILGNETSVGNDVFTGCSSDLIINTVCNNEAIKGYAEENSITTELIHNWGEWQTIEEATFAKEGTKQRTCANDSSHIETETIAKLDKSLLEKHEAKAATCEETGNNEYYSYNGKYYSDSEGTQEIQENSWVIEALGHEYGEATYTWNEDKTECKAERVCTRDASHKETETVKTTNSVTKEATCEEVGERTYTATFTNTAFAEQTTTEEIPALGHTAGQPIEENRVESTCTQEGHYDEVIYCTVCNKEISRETKTIAKKAHTEVIDEAVEPTCTTAGKTEGKHCSVCNEVLEAQEEIPALGHEYGEATYTLSLIHI